MVAEGRRAGYVALSFGLAVLFLIVAVWAWIVWLAADRAWSQYEANRGIRGSFQPVSCETRSFDAGHNASRNQPGYDRTTYQYSCMGAFVPDNGQPPIQVSYVTDVQPTPGQPIRAVAANENASVVYAEGGSYAQYIVIAAGLVLGPMIIVFLAVQKRRERAGVARERERHRLRRSSARRAARQASGEPI